MRRAGIVGLALVGVFALAACEPESDDVVTPTDELPDITGTYDAVFSEPEGCDAYADTAPAWLTGELVVAGEPDALTFTFADGAVLEGSVDAAFTWEATARVGQPGEEVDVYLDGLAFIGDDSWILDGDVAVDRLESTGASTLCTLTGLLEASQIR